MPAPTDHPRRRYRADVSARRFVWPLLISLAVNAALAAWAAIPVSAAPNAERYRLATVRLAHRASLPSLGHLGTPRPATSTSAPGPARASGGRQPSSVGAARAQRPSALAGAPQPGPAQPALAARPTGSARAASSPVVAPAARPTQPELPTAAVVGSAAAGGGRSAWRVSSSRLGGVTGGSPSAASSGPTGASLASAPRAGLTTTGEPSGLAIASGGSAPGASLAAGSFGGGGAAGLPSAARGGSGPSLGSAAAGDPTPAPRATALAAPSGGPASAPAGLASAPAAARPVTPEPAVATPKPEPKPAAKPDPQPEPVKPRPDPPQPGLPATPRLLSRAAPSFPPAAEAGSVTIAISVGTDGGVTGVEVSRSSGQGGIDAAAVAAGRRFRFSAAEHGKTFYQTFRYTPR